MIEDEDPTFDAEVEALLRPGNAELLRGIRPETLAAMGLETPASRTITWRKAVAAGIVALAASFLAFAIVPHEKPRAPTGALARNFSRTLEVSRGSAKPSQQHIYRSDGVLHVDIQQSAEEARVPAELAIFEVDGAGELLPLEPAELRRRVDAKGNIFFEIDGEMRSIFGPGASGAKTLAFVFAADPRTLAELAGTEVSEALAREDLRCFLEEIAIVTSTSN